MQVGCGLGYTQMGVDGVWNGIHRWGMEWNTQMGCGVGYTNGVWGETHTYGVWSGIHRRGVTTRCTIPTLINLLAHRSRPSCLTKQEETHSITIASNYRSCSQIVHDIAIPEKDVDLSMSGHQCPLCGDHEDRD